MPAGLEGGLGHGEGVEGVLKHVGVVVAEEAVREHGVDHVGEEGRPVLHAVCHLVAKRG